MLQLARTKVQLTPAEQAQLRAAALRDAPEFAHRLASPLDIDRLEQPWFRQHRVLEIASSVPFPPRRLHVAAGDGRMRVLTAHIENLRAVAADDRPGGLEAEQAAADYAEHANFWTATHALGELKIGSFDEIPWFASLDDQQRGAIEDLRSRFGQSIRPEQRSRGDGWVFRSWWVAMRQLIERELVVPPDGQLRRTDEVRAADMPVPAGSHWGFVNGRFVPIG